MYRQTVVDQEPKTTVQEDGKMTRGLIWNTWMKGIVSRSCSVVFDVSNENPSWKKMCSWRWNRNVEVEVVSMSRLSVWTKKKTHLCFQDDKKMIGIVNISCVSLKHQYKKHLEKMVYRPCWVLIWKEEKKIKRLIMITTHEMTAAFLFADFWDETNDM